MEDNLKTLMDPVSNQIIQILRVNGPLKAADILNYGLGVSRATLYRKLDKMTSSEIIEVVDTKTVRGQIEKYYGIKNIYITNQADNSERLKTVTMGIMEIVGRYENYFKKDDADVDRDKLFMMNYNIALSDEDFRNMLGEIFATVDKYQSKAVEGAKLRNLYLMSAPVDDM